MGTAEKQLDLLQCPVGARERKYTVSSATIWPKSNDGALAKGEMVYLRRTLANLSKQHAIQFNRDEMLAQCVFALSNDTQFKGIDSFRHKVNILAKLIRTGQWRVPKGFYNHSSEGQAIREAQVIRERTQAAQKQQEATESRAAMSQLMSKFQVTSMMPCLSPLTEQAVALAKQLKRLNEKVKTLADPKEQGILLSLAENLLERLKSLILQGADEQSIKTILSR